jgi:hypothetical protein
MGAGTNGGSVKTALWVLMIVALVVVLVGALNHGTAVSFDYVAGSTPAVSLFWLALGAAAALVLAGIAGWAVAVASAYATRRKLEKELEATYRRLRDCEARLAPPASSPAGQLTTEVMPAPAGEAATAVAPAPADEAVTAADRLSSDEAVTAVAPAPADEAVTALESAPADEAVTSLEPAPADEGAAGDTPSAP